MEIAVTAAAVCGHGIVLIVETSGRCKILFMPTILIMVTCIDGILPVRVLNSLNAMTTWGTNLWSWFKSTLYTAKGLKSWQEILLIRRIRRILGWSLTLSPLAMLWPWLFLRDRTLSCGGLPRQGKEPLGVAQLWLKSASTSYFCDLSRIFKSL